MLEVNQKYKKMCMLAVEFLTVSHKCTGPSSNHVFLWLVLESKGAGPNPSPRALRNGLRSILCCRVESVDRGRDKARVC